MKVPPLIPFIEEFILSTPLNIKGFKTSLEGTKIALMDRKMGREEAIKSQGRIEGERNNDKSENPHEDETELEGNKIFVEHEVENQCGELFKILTPLKDESEGIKKMLGLMRVIYEVINHSGFLAIDDISTSLLSTRIQSYWKR